MMVIGFKRMMRKQEGKKKKKKQESELVTFGPQSPVRTKERASETRPTSRIYVRKEC
jgi:hypothetical protein